MNPNSENVTRWKTAGILLAVAAAVALLDLPFVTWLFFGMVYGAALYEALPLFRIVKVTPYLYGGALWIAAGLYPHPVELVAIALLIWAGVLAYRRTVERHAFLPLLYPTLGILFFWALYREHGMVSLAWLLIIVALTDAGAYYTGRAIGKTSFSPTSPRKTLEGVIGGVIAGTAGGTLLATAAMDIGFPDALIASLVAAAFSVFGDLFESYLKREAGVKDSGTLLPGHGGVLDRIDGYLFAAPTLYILLHIAGH